jgi:hypothetical protein
MPILFGLSNNDSDFRGNLRRVSRFAQDYLVAGFSTGHRTQCPAAIWTSGGKAFAHAGTRNSQRGSKAQPAGMACSGGTVPSIV